MKYERYIGTNPLEIILIMGETFKVLVKVPELYLFFKCRYGSGSRINPNKDPDPGSTK
jgi:hypothetical protein